MANPPGSLTLEQELQALKNRIGELSQRKVILPACRVQLAGNADLPGDSTTFAQTGWVAVDDAFELFTAGSAGVPGYITIQHAGLYHVHYHSAAVDVTPQAGQNPPVAASKVTLNGTSVSANAIATSAAVYTAFGSDGAALDAIRDRLPLTVGDRIYWANWSSVAGTLASSVNAVPTEISVRFLATR